MRVLVACEFSGVVRRAFQEHGHIAFSCDILPPEDGATAWHWQMDVLELLKRDAEWDLMICHPPCTYLATSGARWMKDSTRQCKQVEAIAFAWKLWNAPIPMICMENPRSVLMTHIGRPHQQIHPWQFGHGERKETFLWLKNLPPLNPTDIVDGREARVHREAPGPDRQKNRSRSYPGIAAAMAAQWGKPGRCLAQSQEAPGLSLVNAAREVLAIGVIDDGRLGRAMTRLAAALPSNQRLNP